MPRSEFYKKIDLFKKDLALENLTFYDKDFLIEAIEHFMQSDLQYTIKSIFHYYKLFGTDLDIKKITLEYLLKSKGEKYVEPIAKKLIEIDPYDIDVQDILIYHYSNNKKYSEAIKSLHKAIDILTSNGEIFDEVYLEYQFKLAELYYLTENYSSSVEHYEKSLLSFYKEELDLDNMIDAYIQSCQALRGLVFLTKFYNLYPSQNLLFYIAYLYDFIGVWEKALDFIEKNKKQKLDDKLSNLLGNLYLKLQRHKEYILLYTSQPAVVDAQVNTEKYLKIAEIFIKKNQIQKAIEVLEICKKNEPKNVDVILLFAQLCIKTNSKSQLKKLYLEALDIDPSYFYTWKNAIEYLQESKEKSFFKEVIENLNKYLDQEIVEKLARMTFGIDNDLLYQKIEDYLENVDFEVSTPWLCAFKTGFLLKKNQNVKAIDIIVAGQLYGKNHFKEIFNTLFPNLKKDKKIIDLLGINID